MMEFGVAQREIDGVSYVCTFRPHHTEDPRFSLMTGIERPVYERCKDGKNGLFGSTSSELETVLLVPGAIANLIENGMPPRDACELVAEAIGSKVFESKVFEAATA